jgi:hypothetical protein
MIKKCPSFKWAVLVRTCSQLTFAALLGGYYKWGLLLGITLMGLLNILNQLLLYGMAQAPPNLMHINADKLPVSIL